MVPHVRGLARAVASQFAIARLLAQIERIEADTKLRIERIKEGKEKRVSALEEKIVRRAETLFAFYERNRDGLRASSTGSAAKTDAGECEWYPGAHSIEVLNEDAAIDALVKLKREDALRRKVELNKEFLLENPWLVAKVPGIRIVRHPKRILRFPETKARVELSDDEPVMEIVFPKKKK
jgi:phage host-nuclease inhibitor protein Gam